jgi:hypothetical protein
MKLYLHPFVCIAGWVAMLICFSGCTPNMRYIRSGNMWTMGAIKKGEPVLYPAIWLNLTTNKPIPHLRLRLQNDQVVPLAAVTWEIVKDADYTHNPDTMHPLGSNDFTVEGEGATFHFVNRTLVGVGIGVGEIGIGREDETKFYVAPFTQEELEHLFGHLDRVSDGYFR